MSLNFTKKKNELMNSASEKGIKVKSKRNERDFAN
jgi:hypothetical protein